MKIRFRVVLRAYLTSVLRLDIHSALSSDVAINSKSYLNDVSLIKITLQIVLHLFSEAYKINFNV